jgi:formate dehydrogenase subunit delta
MNIDLLIKMTNEIGDFFAGTGDKAEATEAVARHLRRYWDPRMRAQIIKYYEVRSGAGLSDIALGAVAMLRQAAQAGQPAQAGQSGQAAPPSPASPESADA